MGSVAAAALSEAADAVVRFCPALLITGEAAAATEEWASVDKAVLGRVTELEAVAEGVTCSGNTTAPSVPPSLNVDPNAPGTSLVPGDKTIEEDDSESDEGDASSVCPESRDLVNEASCVNFRSVAVFCVENEGNISFLIVAEEEEVVSTSGEKGGNLVPKIKSAVALAGTVGCKTEVLDTSGCVTASVKCKYF